MNTINIRKFKNEGIFFNGYFSEWTLVERESFSLINE